MPTPSPSQARLRAFVRRETRLRDVPDLPALRLYTGDDVMALCQRAGNELGQADPPLPFWAFPWAGGLAVARYVMDHPEVVAGRRIVDLAAGSGLCGIAAMRAGARGVRSIDIDPLAEAATRLNARANGVAIAFSRRDCLDDPPPMDADLILAGDVCYEDTFARRALAWLRGAVTAGIPVLLGDPGRRYLPGSGGALRRVADYEVHTTRELEPEAIRTGTVWAVEPGTAAATLPR